MRDDAVLRRALPLGRGLGRFVVIISLRNFTLHNRQVELLKRKQ